MKIIRNIKNIKRVVKGLKSKGKIIGLVPTMGALHEGHLSLVRKCRKECDVVITSIFVNPSQFGPKEDFDKYPRTFKKDTDLLKKECVDILFYPLAGEMYPEQFSSFVEVSSLSGILCGYSRPGHFRGVATVVLKLFNIIIPDVAYFGQKDYQQTVIIRRMVKDLNLDIKIRILSIQREYDGLAMSSRNTYLSSCGRQRAVCLKRALEKCRELIVYGGIKNTCLLKKEMEKILKKDLDKIDYIEIVHPDTLGNIEFIQGKVVVMLAGWIDNVRLIDNMILLI